MNGWKIHWVGTSEGPNGRPWFVFLTARADCPKGCRERCRCELMRTSMSVRLGDGLEGTREFRRTRSVVVRPDYRKLAEDFLKLSVEGVSVEAAFRFVQSWGNPSPESDTVTLERRGLSVVPADAVIHEAKRFAQLVELLAVAHNRSKSARWPSLLAGIEGDRQLTDAWRASFMFFPHDRPAPQASRSVDEAAEWHRQSLKSLAEPRLQREYVGDAALRYLNALVSGRPSRVVWEPGQRAEEVAVDRSVRHALVKAALRFRVCDGCGKPLDAGRAQVHPECRNKRQAGYNRKSLQKKASAE